MRTVLNLKAAGLLALVAGMAMPASGQVVINEVFENPPGSTDVFWEFIELYGRPGTDLTGYAVAILKGGFDQNGNDRPDSAFGDAVPEIDEAFSLDGWTIGPDGFFVLYNETVTGISDVAEFLTPNPSYNPLQPESPTNKRYLNGASFKTLHIPTTDTAGNLNNDGSSSYVLVRRRPLAVTTGSAPTGSTVYQPGYAWRKDVNHDVDFDGKTDFGTESPVIPDGSAVPLPVVAQVLQPYQMVDDLAWSHRGGKEYVVSSQQEISDTPRFNPDAVSRLRYYIENPMRGHRTRTVDGNTVFVPTRIADESFIYGETMFITNPNPLGPPLLAVYDTAATDGGWEQVKAPTDLNAIPYDGTCDPEPQDTTNPKPTPAQCPPNPNGEFFITDMNVTGFRLTPGGFNDHPTNPNIQQFRFVTGDFNFDGVVDYKDVLLIQERICATLDDTQSVTDENGTYDAYVWQGYLFQQTLMMLEMNLTDGTGGMNAVQITPADIAAVIAIANPAQPSCPGDVNGDGATNLADFNILAVNFGTATCARRSTGDLNGDGAVNLADFNVLAVDFGCTQ